MHSDPIYYDFFKYKDVISHLTKKINFLYFLGIIFFFDSNKIFYKICIMPIQQTQDANSEPKGQETQNPETQDPITLLLKGVEGNFLESASRSVDLSENVSKFGRLTLTRNPKPIVKNNFDSLREIFNEIFQLEKNESSEFFRCQYPLLYDSNTEALRLICKCKKFSASLIQSFPILIDIINGDLYKNLPQDHVMKSKFHPTNAILSLKIVINIYIKNYMTENYNLQFQEGIKKLILLLTESILSTTTDFLSMEKKEQTELNDSLIGKLVGKVNPKEKDLETELKKTIYYRSSLKIFFSSLNETLNIIMSTPLCSMMLKMNLFEFLKKYINIFEKNKIQYKKYYFYQNIRNDFIILQNELICKITKILLITLFPRGNIKSHQNSDGNIIFLNKNNEIDENRQTMGNFLLYNGIPFLLSTPSYLNDQINQSYNLIIILLYEIKPLNVYFKDLVKDRTLQINYNFLDQKTEKNLPEKISEKKILEKILNPLELKFTSLKSLVVESKICFSASLSFKEVQTILLSLKHYLRRLIKPVEISRDKTSIGGFKPKTYTQMKKEKFLGNKTTANINISHVVQIIVSLNDSVKKLSLSAREAQMFTTECLLMFSDVANSMTKYFKEELFIESNSKNKKIDQKEATSKESARFKNRNKLDILEENIYNFNTIFMTFSSLVTSFNSSNKISTFCIRNLTVLQTNVLNFFYDKMVEIATIGYEESKSLISNKDKIGFTIITNKITISLNEIQQKYLSIFTIFSHSISLLDSIHINYILERIFRNSIFLSETSYILISVLISVPSMNLYVYDNLSQILISELSKTLHPNKNTSSNLVKEILGAVERVSPKIIFKNENIKKKSKRQKISLPENLENFPNTKLLLFFGEILSDKNIVEIDNKIIKKMFGLCQSSENSSSLYFEILRSVILSNSYCFLTEDSGYVKCICSREIKDRYKLKFSFGRTLFSHFISCLHTFKDRSLVETNFNNTSLSIELNNINNFIVNLKQIVNKNEMDTLKLIKEDKIIETNDFKDIYLENPSLFVGLIEYLFLASQRNPENFVIDYIFHNLFIITNVELSNIYLYFSSRSIFLKCYKYAISVFKTVYSNKMYTVNCLNFKDEIRKEIGNFKDEKFLLKEICANLEPETKLFLESKPDYLEQCISMSLKTISEDVMPLKQILIELRDLYRPIKKLKEKNTKDFIKKISGRIYLEDEYEKFISTFDYDVELQVFENRTYLEYVGFPYHILKYQSMSEKNFWTTESNRTHKEKSDDIYINRIKKDLNESFDMYNKTKDINYLINHKNFESFIALSKSLENDFIYQKLSTFLLNGHCECSDYSTKIAKEIDFINLVLISIYNYVDFTLILCPNSLLKTLCSQMLLNPNKIKAIYVIIITEILKSENYKTCPFQNSESLNSKVIGKNILNSKILLLALDILLSNYNQSIIIKDLIQLIIKELINEISPSAEIISKIKFENLDFSKLQKMKNYVNIYDKINNFESVSRSFFDDNNIKYSKKLMLFFLLTDILISRLYLSNCICMIFLEHLFLVLRVSSDEIFKKYMNVIIDDIKILYSIDRNYGKLVESMTHLSSKKIILDDSLIVSFLEKLENTLSFKIDLPTAKNNLPKIGNVVEETNLILEKSFSNLMLDSFYKLSVEEFHQTLKLLSRNVSIMSNSSAKRYITVLFLTFKSVYCNSCLNYEKKNFYYEKGNIFKTKNDIFNENLTKNISNEVVYKFNSANILEQKFTLKGCNKNILHGEISLNIDMYITTTMNRHPELIPFVNLLCNELAAEVMVEKLDFNLLKKLQNLTKNSNIMKVKIFKNYETSNLSSNFVSDTPSVFLLKYLKKIDSEISINLRDKQQSSEIKKYNLNIQRIYNLIDILISTCTSKEDYSIVLNIAKNYMYNNIINSVNKNSYNIVITSLVEMFNVYPEFSSDFLSSLESDKAANLRMLETFKEIFLGDLKKVLFTESFEQSSNKQTKTQSAIFKRSSSDISYTKFIFVLEKILKNCENLNEFLEFFSYSIKEIPDFEKILQEKNATSILNTSEISIENLVVLNSFLKKIFNCYESEKVFLNLENLYLRYLNVLDTIELESNILKSNIAIKHNSIFVDPKLITFNTNMSYLSDEFLDDMFYLKEGEVLSPVKYLIRCNILDSFLNKPVVANNYKIPFKFSNYIYRNADDLAFFKLLFIKNLKKQKSMESIITSKNYRGFFSIFFENNISFVLFYRIYVSFKDFSKKEKIFFLLGKNLEILLKNDKINAKNISNFAECVVFYCTKIEENGYKIFESIDLKFDLVVLIYRMLCSANNSVKLNVFRIIYVLKNRIMENDFNLLYTVISNFLCYDNKINTCYCEFDNSIDEKCQNIVEFRTEKNVNSILVYESNSKFCFGKLLRPNISLKFSFIQQFNDNTIFNYAFIEKFLIFEYKKNFLKTLNVSFLIKKLRGNDSNHNSAEEKYWMTAYEKCITYRNQLYSLFEIAVRYLISEENVSYEFLRLLPHEFVVKYIENLKMSNNLLNISLKDSNVTYIDQNTNSAKICLSYFEFFFYFQSYAAKKSGISFIEIEEFKKNSLIFDDIIEFSEKNVVKDFETIKNCENENLRKIFDFVPSPWSFSDISREDVISTFPSPLKLDSDSILYVCFILCQFDVNFESFYEFIAEDDKNFLINKEYLKEKMKEIKDKNLKKILEKSIKILDSENGNILIEDEILEEEIIYDLECNCEDYAIYKTFPALKKKNVYTFLIFISSECKFLRNIVYKELIESFELKDIFNGISSLVEYRSMDDVYVSINNGDKSFKIDLLFKKIKEKQEILKNYVFRDLSYVCIRIIEEYLEVSNEEENELYFKSYEKFPEEKILKYANFENTKNLENLGFKDLKKYEYSFINFVKNTANSLLSYNFELTSPIVKDSYFSRKKNILNSDSFLVNQLGYLEEAQKMYENDMDENLNSDDPSVNKDFMIEWLNISKSLEQWKLIDNIQEVNVNILRESNRLEIFCDWEDFENYYKFSNKKYQSQTILEGKVLDDLIQKIKLNHTEKNEKINEKLKNFILKNLKYLDSENIKSNLKINVEDFLNENKEIFKEEKFFKVNDHPKTIPIKQLINPSYERFVDLMNNEEYVEKILVPFNRLPPSILKKRELNASEYMNVGKIHVMHNNKKTAHLFLQKTFTFDTIDVELAASKISYEFHLYNKEKNEMGCSILSSGDCTSFTPTHISDFLSFGGDFMQNVKKNYVAAEELYRLAIKLNNKSRSWFEWGKLLQNKEIDCGNNLKMIYQNKTEKDKKPLNNEKIITNLEKNSEIINISNLENIEKNSEKKKKKYEKNKLNSFNCFLQSAQSLSYAKESVLNIILLFDDKYFSDFFKKLHDLNINHFVFFTEKIIEKIKNFDLKETKKIYEEMKKENKSFYEMSTFESSQVLKKKSAENVKCNLLMILVFLKEYPHLLYQYLPNKFKHLLMDKNTSISKTYKYIQTKLNKGKDAEFFASSDIKYILRIGNCFMNEVYSLIKKFEKNKNFEGNLIDYIENNENIQKILSFNRYKGIVHKYNLFGGNPIKKISMILELMELYDLNKNSSNRIFDGKHNFNSEKIYLPFNKTPMFLNYEKFRNYYSDDFIFSLESNKNFLYAMNLNGEIKTFRKKNTNNFATNLFTNKICKFIEYFDDEINGEVCYLNNNSVLKMKNDDIDDENMINGFDPYKIVDKSVLELKNRNFKSNISCSQIFSFGNFEIASGTSFEEIYGVEKVIISNVYFLKKLWYSFNEYHLKMKSSNLELADNVGVFEVLNDVLKETIFLFGNNCFTKYVRDFSENISEFLIFKDGFSSSFASISALLCLTKSTEFDPLDALVGKNGEYFIGNLVKNQKEKVENLGKKNVISISTFRMTPSIVEFLGEKAIMGRVLSINYHVGKLLCNSSWIKKVSEFYELDLNELIEKGNDMIKDRGEESIKKALRLLPEGRYCYNDLPWI